MRSIEVVAPELSVAAGRYDEVAGALAQILLSVRVQGQVDTGRGDTSAQVAEVVDAFSRALQALGTAAVLDADALRAAAGGYLRTDQASMRAG